MKTLSIKFYLKPYANTHRFTVTVRILYNRKKAEFSTGIKCKKSEWNKKKEEFKNNSILNERLAAMKGKIYKAKHELEDTGRYFDAKDIKYKVDSKTISNNQTLIEFFREYLDKKEVAGDSKPSTLAKYNQTYRVLEGFLFDTRRIHFMTKEIEYPFIAEFDEYLKDLVYNEYGDKLTLTSVNKHHSRLKAVVNAAKKKGLLLYNPYENFKLSFPPGNREYLTSEELRRIQSLQLSNNETLDKVRDIFMFSCYTGLRFQDAMHLTMDKIMPINDEVYLRITQQKTETQREIPLLQPALDIISKYSLAKERLVKGNVLPTMSNPKFNSYIKHIAELAEINKHLTHHVARHTCATTILLDNHVPLETVSHWLGHNSVRTTQVYAKISHRNLSKEVNRINKLIMEEC